MSLLGGVHLLENVCHCECWLRSLPCSSLAQSCTQFPSVSCRYRCRTLSSFFRTISSKSGSPALCPLLVIQILCIWLSSLVSTQMFNRKLKFSSDKQKGCSMIHYIFFFPSQSFPHDNQLCHSLMSGVEE